MHLAYIMDLDAFNFLIPFAQVGKIWMESQDCDLVT